MGLKVGIDLGTTFSAVAYVDPRTGQPRIVKNGYGEATTPSVLSFEPSGEVLFGKEAKERQAEGYANVASFFKRCMGVESFRQEILGKSYGATDFSSILLQKLKIDAEKELGEEITEAVITVPAYFTHRERTATIKAGEQAGLKVIAIINEPTAAAFAYGLNSNEPDSSRRVLIYDLGGGTFDVTVAQIDGEEIRILGSDGDHALGGKDWDDAVARYLMEEFEERHDLDLSEDPEAINALLVMAEDTKKS